MDWFNKRVDCKPKLVVCIDLSRKSSTACFVKISPSPNFLITLYHVVLHNLKVDSSK